MQRTQIRIALLIFSFITIISGVIFLAYYTGQNTAPVDSAAATRGQSGSTSGENGGIAKLDKDNLVSGIPTKTVTAKCAQDVKICDGGGYVSRDPNKACAFSECSTTDKITCGAMDFDNNNILNLKDFANLSTKYGSSCKDKYSSTLGCGGADADGNGKIEASDFKSLFGRFGKVGCELPLTTDAKPVACGAIDIDGSDVLDYTDYAEFMAYLGKSCNDSYPKTKGCGGKDTNANGVVDDSDFQSFIKRQNVNGCAL